MITPSRSPTPRTEPRYPPSPKRLRWPSARRALNWWGSESSGRRGTFARKLVADPRTTRCDGTHGERHRRVRGLPSHRLMREGPHRAVTLERWGAAPVSRDGLSSDSRRFGASVRASMSGPTMEPIPTRCSPGGAGGGRVAELRGLTRAGASWDGHVFGPVHQARDPLPSGAGEMRYPPSSPRLSRPELRRREAPRRRAARGVVRGRCRC
jgi:hypothetical protein